MSCLGCHVKIVLIHGSPKPVKWLYSIWSPQPTGKHYGMALFRGRPVRGGGGSRNATPGPEMIVYKSHLSDQPYTPIHRSLHFLARFFTEARAIC